MKDHPFVYRLMVEMGDHPVNRDYYVVARRRLHRWFRELQPLSEVLSKIVLETLGDRPEYPGPGQDDYDMAKGCLLNELKQEFKDDPWKFQEEHRVHIPDLLLRPPPDSDYEFRFSSQIIEAAIALRIRDLDEEQRLLASEEVARAGNAYTTWRERWWLLRAGVIPPWRVFARDPMSRLARPPQ
jgi:hypothetical protein